MRGTIILIRGCYGSVPPRAARDITALRQRGVRQKPAGVPTRIWAFGCECAVGGGCVRPARRNDVRRKRGEREGGEAKNRRAAPAGAGPEPPGAKGPRAPGNPRKDPGKPPGTPRRSRETPGKTSGTPRNPRKARPEESEKKIYTDNENKKLKKRRQRK